MESEFNHKKHIILFIFDYKCAICCAAHKSNHVHHIDGNHLNNDAFNLVILCKEHHKLTHRLNLAISVTSTLSQYQDLQRLNIIWCNFNI